MSPIHFDDDFEADHDLSILEQAKEIERDSGRMNRAASKAKANADRFSDLAENITPAPRTQRFAGAAQKSRIKVKNG